MRLLEVDTYAIREFLESDVPAYAILSHTWGKDEVSFQDIQRLRSAKKKAAFSKIAQTCLQAKRDGLEYVWVDTCINKDSSAELQEAINSMYRWYAEAAVCYAYLADIDWGLVPAGCDPAGYAPDPPVRFQGSVWFSRGWTLQELIAPRDVKFYGNVWQPLGTRTSALKLIAETTKIDTAVLTHSATLSSVSVAKRMSWAANRRTSRTEDLAYCLLGLFGVSIPMLYGEGSRSFIRLQEEILRTSNDHSIFSWGVNGLKESYDLLASSPADFAGCYDVVPWGRPGQFQMTNRGLRIRLPVIRLESVADPVPLSSDHEDAEYLGILNCRQEDRMEETLALRLRKRLDVDEYNVSARRSVRENEGIRLISAVLERIPFVEPKQVEIARSLEQRESPLKFWFRFSRDARYTREREDFYPADSWNDKRTIMRPPILQGNEGPSDAGKSRGRRGIDTEAAVPAEYYAPAIYISQDPPLALALECHNVLRCPYPEPCTAQSESHCPYRKQTCTSRIDALGSVWQVSASIRQSSMMGETLFIIDASVDCHNEIETIEPVVELEAIEWVPGPKPEPEPVPEPIPYQEFEYPLAAVTGAWEVAKQFNSDVEQIKPDPWYRAAEPAWKGEGLRAMHGLREHENHIL